jgi:hypothetical protein
MKTPSEGYIRGKLKYEVPSRKLNESARRYSSFISIVLILDKQERSFGGAFQRITMPRVIRCELCGNSFMCGMGSGQCWCTHLKVTLEALNVLKGLATDCVCPNCLNRFTPH